MTLRAGDLEAVVEGGAQLSVTSLRHRGDELLVGPGELPGPYRIHDARAGITLLHPWANRLAPDARVPDGAPRDPNGLPIHGLPLAWRVDGGRAVGDVAFPVAHRVAVSLELFPEGLTVTTRLEALEDPAPVAFGWHPYFRLPGAERPDWRLTLPARERIAVDDRGLPTGERAAEAAESAPLADRAFDDGYAGLAEGAELALAAGGREIRVTLDRGYPAAQVFAPLDATLVALEPMTAVTNALHTGETQVVAPGEAFTAVFRVLVSG